MNLQFIIIYTKYLMCTLINFVLLILAIAFYTIVERKILGIIILRIGPNKPRFIGILTPLIDALKLLTKHKIIYSNIISIYTIVGPIIVFVLILLIWRINPNIFLERSLFRILWFLALSSLSVYGIFLRSWGSNSKYPVIGAIRSVAQTISFEISSGILLISFIVNIGKFDINEFYYFPSILCWGWFLFILWTFLILIETNRTPFDLIEGESELVRGFNTEYGRVKFALLFLGEYGIIIFVSIITRNLFFFSFLDFLFPIITLLFIWIRRTIPRIRYDNLIKFIWKFILPLNLRILILLI